MKRLLVFVFALILCTSQSQVVLNMKKVGGVYEIPCKVNGLNLSFIFDTGASDISISLIEALFMIRHGYLKEENILGSVKYSIANGDIAEGTKILLKEVEIGGLKLYNVEASIVHEMEAPLLLGQSAIQKLGKIQFEGNKLTIFRANNLTLLDANNCDNYKQESYNEDTCFITFVDYYCRAKNSKDNKSKIYNYSCAIKLQPYHADSYWRRAHAKKYLKDSYGALADYTKAIELDPNFAWAYHSRGWLKHDLGQPYCSDWKKACELGHKNSCEWYEALECN